MKLANHNYEAVFQFEDASAIEWVIESPVVYRNIVSGLINQLQGNEGDFILSDADKILPIAKSMDLILDLFEIDVNQKKLLNRLYAEMKEVSFSEKYYMETQEMLSNLKKYFYDMEQEVSYNIHVDDEIDIVQVMKSVGISIETDSISLLENICEYVKISTRLLNIKVFILCNAQSFLTGDELKELVTMASYEECYLLLLENHEDSSQVISKRYIIDKDGCEIFDNE